MCHTLLDTPLCQVTCDRTESAMARPIEPTPTLEGAAAERLLSDLETVCTPAEAKSRVEWARRERAAMMGQTIVPDTSAAPSGSGTRR